MPAFVGWARPTRTRRRDEPLTAEDPEGAEKNRMPAFVGWARPTRAGYAARGAAAFTHSRIHAFTRQQPPIRVGRAHPTKTVLRILCVLCVER
jgi:hypothetical protein